MAHHQRVKESESLLGRWRRERATRIISSISPVAAMFAVVTTSADYFFGMPLIVLLGDIALLAGSFFSFYLIRIKKSKSSWNWVPVYFGVWSGCSTSLWVTGGILSPFITGYITILFVAGLVIQPQVRSFFVTGFALLQLIFWALLPKAVTDANLFPPPPIFVFVINCVVLVGLMICIYEFLRTERNLAEEVVAQYKKLADAKDNLIREEAASAAKSNFLANISHELRTPLGAIMGYAELIQDPNVAENEKTDFVETIRRNGLQLSRLVDDLLDLSKVEAGKLEVEAIAFKPSQAIQEVYDLLILNAKRKGIDLRMKQFNSPLETVSSDPLRFKQILMNVVGNAVKFTETGAVDIFIHYPDRDHRGKETRFRIEVRDTGRGLSLDEQMKLFKPFSQADASVTRKFGGTGLGLNLSRRLAQLLGGDLYLEWSQPGTGSCFVLSLPWVMDASADSCTSPSVLCPTSPEKNHLLGRRILVVDDTIDNQNLISRYLEKWGVSVELASDGFEGIQKAMAGDFDMILMDVQMPVMDGIQAATLLRQKRYHKPILALTAHAMKEDRDRCLAAGFNDYLTKPVDRKLLKDKIQAATADLISNENLI